MENHLEIEDLLLTDLAEPLESGTGVPFVRRPVLKNAAGKPMPCKSCGTPTRMSSLCAVCSVESRLIAVGCDINHGIRHLKGKDLDEAEVLRPRGRTKALKP